MQFIRTLLEEQQLMTLFLTIAIGYVVGEINVRGFSLGIGAVLFVALGVGWFAPNSAPSPAIGTIGLAIFLYAVGVQYGRQFFAGLTSVKGLKANLIALAGVLSAGLVSILFVSTANIKPGYALGLFAGAGTSTPTLQAAITTLGNDDPAVGYSVAYPFGVAGPILLLYLTFIFLKPKLDTTSTSGFELLEIALQRPEFFGRQLSELVATLPADVQVVTIRRNHHNQPASSTSIMAENDVLLVVGPSKEILAQVKNSLGQAIPGSIVQDRRDLDYLRLFASRSAVVGRSLGNLNLPGDKPSIVIQVRRGDTDLQPRLDLILEFGDRVGLLANRDDFPVIRKFFGDSIRGTAEFSYISIGLGMAAGFLFGAISFPLPGIGKVSLGIAGVLIVALVVGYLRRSAGMNWIMPLSANLVLRNLGLTLFLAQVGLASGPKFADAVAESGLFLLVLSAAILIALVVPILVLGLLVLKMPFDELAGTIAGACGNPAILAYSSRLAPTEKPDLAYAMIFPSMTIAKILFVDLVPAFL